MRLHVYCHVHLLVGVHGVVACLHLFHLLHEGLALCGGHAEIDFHATVFVAVEVVLLQQSVGSVGHVDVCHALLRQLARCFYHAADAVVLVAEGDGGAHGFCFLREEQAAHFFRDDDVAAAAVEVILREGIAFGEAELEEAEEARLRHLHLHLVVVDAVGQLHVVSIACIETHHGCHAFRRLHLLEHITEEGRRDDKASGVVFHSHDIQIVRLAATHFGCDVGSLHVIDLGNEHREGDGEGRAQDVEGGVELGLL